jgi:hypothetical protein
MPALAKIHWYFNRLRLMQPAEVGHRLLTQLHATVGAVLSARAAVSPQPDLSRFGKPWCTDLPRGSVAGSGAVIDAADRILGGRWSVFALRDALLGFPPTWNCDPLTGIVAPLRFGKTLDYRDESLVGNIKYLWEPARHLELVTLAQAWRATGEPRYLKGCAALLTSWFDQCPYGQGVHWSSSLELGVRLVNWAVAWHLLDGAEGPLFAGLDGESLRLRWLDIVFQHQRFVAGHLSRYSSANNHLLGELMGLFVASLTWPCWPQSAQWRRMSHVEFRAEALRQNWEDGVNKEQGIYYHHEVADMMLLCALFGRASGVEFDAAFWHRLESMLGFIDAMMDARGNVPMIGDADDALMVRFDPSPDFDPYRSLLETGAALFGRPEWRRSTNDVKTRWLLGGTTAQPAPDAPDGEGRSSDGGHRVDARSFPQGGYWVMQYASGTSEEVRIVADAGPLGYLSIAAHGHADALAFVLSLGGQPVLIDPGTYAYHTQRRWRDYFRGTAAHNTLCVDGMDQSEIGGNFMWLRKANASCVSFVHDAEMADWLAEHDGYTRLRDPLVHRRRIRFEPALGRLRVTDSVKCARQHSLAWHWHFDPRCKIDLFEDAVIVTAGDWLVRLRLPHAVSSMTVHRGQDDPPLGWISRRFDHKEPATTLRCECSMAGGNLDFVTEFFFERKKHEERTIP